MPTEERGGDERRPRFDPPERRGSPAVRRTVRKRNREEAALRAEIDSLRRRLADAEERLRAVERTCDRREEILRACTMCGRVTARYGLDTRCPYCEHGDLRRV